jgi:hypothetical protein
MTFKNLVGELIQFFNGAVIPLLFSLIFLVFLWGLVQYFFIKREDPKSRAEGLQFMLWGIIGMAVVVSMWGLTKMLLSSFGIN